MSTIIVRNEQGQVASRIRNIDLSMWDGDLLSDGFTWEVAE